MAKEYKLSQTDRDALEEIVRRFLKESKEVLGNPQVLNQAFDTYVVRTPTEGIPAVTLNETGTGSGALDDEPNSASCQVHQILDPDGTGAIADRLVPVTGFSITVYNISVTDDIPGNVYIEATKDKYGKWVGSQALGTATIVYGVLQSDLAQGGTACMSVDEWGPTGMEADPRDDNTCSPTGS